MIGKRTWSDLGVAAVLSFGCSAQDGDPGAVGTLTQAIGPCNETVPANRFIDGLPAYAQCAATENSAIYSNNGVDTATASMGSDWVRTQSSGGYQCTELAHRYLLFKWNVKWLPNGNAGQWCDTPPTATSGVVQTSSPVHGDIMVLAPGSCGADGVTGHVAVVDVVGAKLTVVQQNVAARSSYATSCAKCFLHVVANDGSVTPGAGGAAGTGGAPLSTGGFASGAGGFAGGGFVSGAGGFAGAGGSFAPAAGGYPVSPGAGGAPPMPSAAAPVTTPPASSAGRPPASPTSAVPAAGGQGAIPVTYGGQAGDATAPGSEAPGSNGARMTCAVRGPESNGSGAGLGLVLFALAASNLRRRARSRD